MLTLTEITETADEVLRAALGPYGFVQSEVVDDRDVDGEDAVRVTARFKPGSGPANGKAALEALTTLHDALRGKGEERFPFLRYDYADDEPLDQQSDDIGP
ncbi:hypothetical protein [Methylobacterium trifolii]|uniref:Uncharacterized protein n=1 Tax=Methylobacterium trifolii TaxID=1003092 RepID=A0ABQ4TYS0_9HYPH|nr:hypothetical protein [Methylobacterium trifolii]GJE60206.1 hypothetical protein MPOCJGCO_2317 [Methylobacterium trifolii]